MKYSPRKCGGRCRRWGQRWVLVWLLSLGSGLSVLPQECWILYEYNDMAATMQNGNSEV